MPALTLSLGARRVGGRQALAGERRGGSQSVPAELQGFYRLKPHLRTGGDAGTRASHPAVTQEPKLQHFGQLLSEVHHYKLYLQLTGASRCFFN